MPQQALPFEGQNALITGGGTGVGAALAIQSHCYIYGAWGLKNNFISSGRCYYGQRGRGCGDRCL
jgi:hypothetical protein